MALTRKYLSTMGIEDDKIEQIIQAHTETVNGLKEERDKYKDDADKVPDLQNKIKELEDAAKDSGKDTFKVKYEEVKQELEDLKTSIENEKVTANKTGALKELLEGIGLKETLIDKVIKLSDMETIKLGEDGKIEKADELAESYKKEWADFITTKQEKGAETKKPPAGGSEKPTMEQLDEMSIEDYIAARQE